MCVYIIIIIIIISSSSSSSSKSSSSSSNNVCVCVCVCVVKYPPKSEYAKYRCIYVWLIIINFYYYYYYFKTIYTCVHLYNNVSCFVEEIVQKWETLRARIDFYARCNVYDRNFQQCFQFNGNVMLTKTGI